jgi:hypothetical protein
VLSVCFCGCFGSGLTPAQKAVEKELSGIKNKSLEEKRAFFDQRNIGVKLYNTDKPFLNDLKYPPFFRLDPWDESIETEYKSFVLRTRYAFTEIKEEQLDQVKLRTNLLSSTNIPDLIAVDDFYPLYPSDFSMYFQDLGRFVVEQKGAEARTAVLSSPFNSATGSFLSESYSFSPLGYEEQAAFVTYALDFCLLVYNLRAMEIFRTLQPLWSESVDGEENEGGSKEAQEELEPEVEKAIEEYSFNEFVDFLHANEMKFYYPDYKSSNEQTRKAGFAFLCQLIFWQSPRDYEELLKNTSSRNVGDIIGRAFDFLQKESSLFKAESSLESILERVTHENLLAGLPGDTDLDNFSTENITKEQLAELGTRLSFGFLPESFYLANFADAEFLRRNRQMLEEERRIIIEQRERRLKAQQRKLNARRRSRGRPQKGGEEEQEEEESPEGEEEEQEESPEEAVRLSSVSQLVTMSFPKMVALRRYFAIPSGAPDKKKALIFINRVLASEVQKALTMRPLYLRAASDIVNTEVYVVKMSEPSRKESFKKGKHFTIEAAIPQIEQQERLLPLLNHFYLRAFSNYGLYEKNG